MAKTLKIRPRSQRVRDDDSTDEPYSDELEGSSPSVMIDGEDVDNIEGASEDDTEDEDSSGDDGEAVRDSKSLSDSEEADADMQTQLSKVSFADLAKAQARMSKAQTGEKKRKRGADTSADTSAKLEALRERLRELRENKGIPTANSSKAQRHGGDAVSNPDSNLGSDTDSDATGDSPTKRSKHAPMAAPSNKAVTRKRTVVASNKPASARARDPRFAPLSGSAPTSDQLAKNYAFLDDYRQSEIAELKSRLGENKKGKDRQASHTKKTANKLGEEDKARLRRELARMESQEQSRREKHRLQEVARRHKGEETGKIAQGKNPFFLKKSERKRLALVNKFEGMKSKQRDKALDRRRKKVAGKEKKAMPAARRGVAASGAR